MTFMIDVKEALEYFKKTDMIIEEGEVYTIYACGHILLVSDDPQISKYFPKKRKNFRSCPICDEPTHLIAKYKLCKCGVAHIGNAMVSSDSCRCCCKRKILFGEDLIINKNKKNQKFADPNRWDCIHRDECLDEFMGYQTIPCLNCEKYKSKND